MTLAISGHSFRLPERLSEDSPALDLRVRKAANGCANNQVCLTVKLKRSFFHWFGDSFSINVTESVAQTILSKSGEKAENNVISVQTTEAFRNCKETARIYSQLDSEKSEGTIRLTVQLKKTLFNWVGDSVSIEAPKELVGRIFDKMKESKISLGLQKNTFLVNSSKEFEVWKNTFKKLPLQAYEIKEKILKDNFPEYQALSKSKKDSIKEFIRRIKNDEFKRLFKEIEDLHPLEHDELKAIQTLNWEHSIFKGEHLNKYALIEFFKGAIDVNQLVEIFLHFESLLQKGTTLELFDSEGKRNEETVKLLQEQTVCYFSSEQIDQFFEKAKELPFSCRRIYQVPKQQRTVATRLHEIQYQLLNDYTSMMILSPRLLHMLHQTKVGDQAMPPNPVLGGSIAPENFEHPNRRDVLMPCRLFPKSTPDIADGFYAPPMEFYFHDSYHLYLDTLNPHRTAWIELAKLFKTSDKKLYNRMIDREFRHYETGTASESFFLILLRIATRRKHIKTILGHILENEAVWKTTHKIDISTESIKSTITPKYIFTEDYLIHTNVISKVLDELRSKKRTAAAAA